MLVALYVTEAWDPNFDEGFFSGIRHLTADVINHELAFWIFKQLALLQNAQYKCSSTGCQMYIFLIFSLTSDP